MFNPPRAEQNDSLRGVSGLQRVCVLITNRIFRWNRRELLHNCHTKSDGFLGETKPYAIDDNARIISPLPNRSFRKAQCGARLDNLVAAEAKLARNPT